MKKYNKNKMNFTYNHKSQQRAVANLLDKRVNNYNQNIL